jgi:hypothetical protein
MDLGEMWCGICIFIDRNQDSFPVSDLNEYGRFP